ncbi:MAG: M6 family metalloprotease domain-containing protein [Candidatus Bathyarchaeia archaeon]|nr:M6 family metalloprotease domain-containing protein [Candidatus Bathyarchaeota archaeon]
MADTKRLNEKILKRLNGIKQRCETIMMSEWRKNYSKYMIIATIVVQCIFINLSLKGPITVRCSENQIETTGPQSTIVILVEFKDLIHRKSKEDLKMTIFERLNDYLKETSFESAWLTGNVTDWTRLQHEVSEYGRDFGPFIDVEARRLVLDSIHAVDSYVNFRDYRHIIIVHAGRGQETTGNLSDIWSCYRKLNPPAYADELIINNVIIAPEIQAGDIDPFGVYAHEFMHSLGLPDLYPGSDKIKSRYLGPWDVMDSGLRNGLPSGSKPSHPSAWSKITLGWPIKTTIIFQGSREKIVMYPLEVSTANIQAVILPITQGKYYLIETRIQYGFDSGLPNSGVLITIVDEGLSPGNGMVKVINADPSKPNLENATFKDGHEYLDKTRLVKVSISKTGETYTLTIDRRIEE